MTHIRPLVGADHASLATLFQEMQAYYNAPCPPQKKIIRDLERLPIGTEILIAEMEGIAGFAAFSAVYPGPGLTTGIFLKELFVSKAFRNIGIGSQLIAAICRIAVERGYNRVDWTADREDARLIAFYERFGALAQTQKAFYRLNGEALLAAAKSGGAH